MRLLSFVLCSSIFLAAGFTGLCQSGKASIQTEGGYRVDLSYEQTLMGDSVLVNFSKVDVKGISGKALKNKDKVKVVIFDTRSGLTQFLSDGSVEPLVTSSTELQIDSFDEGYLFIREGTVLTFKRLEFMEDIGLKIPMYAAEEKSILPSSLKAKFLGNPRYNLTGMMTIDITVPAVDVHEVPGGSVSQPPVTADNLPESAGNRYEDIYQMIDKVNALLKQQTSLPLSRTLNRYYDDLRDRVGEIDDLSVKEDVNSTLDAVDQKEEELAEDVENMELQKKAEEDSLQAVRQEQERAEQQVAEDAEQENKTKKMIGAALLIVGGIIGNQFLQYFRNIKTQKKMLEMQRMMEEGAGKKAEGKVRQLAGGGVAKARKGIGRVKDDISKNTRKPSGEKSKRKPPKYTI